MAPIPRQPHHSPHLPPRARAFTLIELMISIALALLLLIGVERVFKITSDTVGASKSLGAIVRDNRTAQATMYTDFAGYAPDSPYLLIRSSSTYAFRDAQDRLADRDASTGNATAQRQAMATIDLNNNGKEGELQTVSPGERISPFTVNSRSHRVDLISFFSRGTFARQTGDTTGTTLTKGDGPLVSPMTTGEAMVWYGHLRLWNGPNPLATGNPNATLTDSRTANGRRNYPDPGALGTNTSSPPLFAANGATPFHSNYYAVNWILGRVATLLRYPAPSTIGYYARQDPTAAYAANLKTLSPLARIGNGSNTFTPATPWRIESSRFDLAETSIAQFRYDLSYFIQASNAGTSWWDYAPANNTTPTLCYRFCANPRPPKIPITASVTGVPDYSIAQSTPCFLSGCTQFIVEYAGDFFAQDASGNITNYYEFGPGSTDGEIDYVLVPGPNNTFTKRIRWYGFPRNIDTSDDTTAGPVIAGTVGLNPYNTKTVNDMVDVVPLRDVAVAAGVTFPNGRTSAPFESFLANPNGPTAGAFTPPANNNYADMGNSSNSDIQPSYTCAFGPDDPKPWLIRITIQLDDPNNRLPNGQVFEYVFRLK